MILAGYTLPDVVLFPAAGIAAGSLVLPVVGLVTVWMLRRHALPLRHALLLGTLVVLAMLPVLIPWLESRGLGWNIHPEMPDSPRSLVPLMAAHWQGADDSLTLELPTDGSLDAEGMTVAEVMARYETSARPVTTSPTPPMFTSEAAFDVRRLVLPAGSCLCLIWLVGSGCSLFRALRAGRALRRLTRRSAPIHEPQLVELLSRCARDAGVRRQPLLVGSEGATVPYVSGLLRPRIVLPPSLVAQDMSTVRGILLHELAHIRRRDLWVGFLQRFTAAIYWWNPLVHRLNLRLAEFREDLCDNYALARISDPREYAQALVELASQAAAAHVVPAMGLLTRSPNRLTGRIQRILQEDRPMATRLGGVSKVLLLVFVFALGVGSTLFVIRLPDILPETVTTGPAFLDAPPVLVESQPEPMISLVRNDAVASNAAPESANWDVVVSPPVAPSGEAANLRAYAVESADQVVPAGNALLPTVPDAASPAAFVDEPAPQDPGPAPGDFGAPPSEVGPPLDSPTTGSAPVPLQEPGTSTLPFAPAFEEPRPTGIDPFSSAPGLSLPEPARAVETLLPLNSVAEPAPPPKALVLVELTANADGSVKQLRYLTEELGNDAAAFQKLEERIQAWAAQFPIAVGAELTVQIIGDPQLRFEHVSRVMTFCSPLVTHVRLAKAETEQQVTITVGFVRDAQGRPVMTTPVVFWQDEVVRLGELRARLEMWTVQLSVPTPAVGHSGRPLGELKDYTVVVRCDGNVDYKIIETIMQDARQVGFEYFAIRAIDVAENVVPGVSGVVTEFDQEQRLVQVSLGADDGLVVGESIILRDGESLDPHRSLKAYLAIVELQSDSATCRVLREMTARSIRVGDEVWIPPHPAAGSDQGGVMIPDPVE